MMTNDDYNFNLFLSEKKSKYGYIDENDSKGLSKIFNSYMTKIYNNTILFFDTDFLVYMYPVIYDELASVLYSYIDMGIGPKQFNLNFCFAFSELMEEFISENNIDIFSDDYLLSKGKFDELDKKILSARMPYILLEANNSILNKDCMKKICNSCGVSKLIYTRKCNMLDGQVVQLVSNKIAVKSYFKR